MTAAVGGPGVSKRPAIPVPKHMPEHKLAVFSKLGWRPHEAQLKLLQSDTRHRLVCAGRRTGKSEFGGYELYYEAMRTYVMRHFLHDISKRREFWIVGPNYSDSEKEFRVVYNLLKKQGAPFDKPGTYNDPTGGNMHISLYDGAFQIHAKSAAHPESLVGEGLCGVIMSEAAKVKSKVWTKFVRPMLNDYHGWSLHSSTPEGRNHFYDLYEQGQSRTHADWFSIRTPSWVNPYVYPGGATMEAIDEIRWYIKNRVEIPLEARERLPIDPEIVALLLDLTDETFNQEIAALFTEYVGRVFKTFDEDVHVRDLEYKPGWETFAAVDYGYTNPFVWLLIQYNPRTGQVHILDEYYKQHQTIPEAIAAVRQLGLAPSSLRTFYPDPASPGDSKWVARELHLQIGRNTGGEVNDRVDAIRLLLRSDAKLNFDPKLLINRKCTETRREFDAYRYPEKRGQQDLNSPENPQKKDDHTIEAFGRFVAGHIGLPRRNARRARSTQAAFG